MLQYPEIVTNLDFIKVSTMPLELRAGTEVVVSETKPRDGAYVEPAIVSYRKAIELEDYRLHTPKQVLILDDLKLSRLSVDKVTQFSLRPPEFLQLFNELGNYFRWFHISDKVKETDFPNAISECISTTLFVDGLQRVIKVRKKALPEIISWCSQRLEEEGLDIDDEDSDLATMICLFYAIDETAQNGYHTNEDGEVDYYHVQKLLHVDEKEHLPIPVFSYIPPTINTSFLLHIMLSMGKSETEIDLLTHGSIQESLRYFFQECV